MNQNDDYKKYSIGDYTYGFPKIYDWNDGTTLTIGKFCSIADNVTILLGGNHRMDWITTFPFSDLPKSFPDANQTKGHPASKGPIEIGNDVWIGFGATILSGLTIGHGACIGAQAVVTKNISPYEIVAGNPAKVIGRRFSETQIESLLNIAWWDWPIVKIKSQFEHLLSPDVKRFIDNNEKKR
jgi:acetyltransferase-like isoleucine patch superfamily enzyme